jgi:1,4-dihydroxy-2-naphthoate octaprenyltransferase
VKRAAFLAFGVAGLAGLVLAASTAWWLVAVGLVCVLAAWYYTGGSRPYGYLGLGEVMVFVFFGLVAVIGTTYVQVEGVPWPAVVGACAIGSLACALLVANNLRDIPTDRATGKRTLAVVLDDRKTRGLYVGLLAVPYLLAIMLCAVTWWSLLALLSLPFAVRAARRVLAGGRELGLLPVLRDTGLAELAYAVALTVGWFVAAA